MKRTSASVAVLLLLATPVMSAPALHTLAGAPAGVWWWHAGSCITNKGWYSANYYEGGRIVRLRGHDAFEMDYELEAAPHTVPADPTGGERPTFSGIGANGVRWFALVRYDANRRVIWQGGRATDGTYWEWSAPPEHAGSGAGDPDLR